MEAQMNLLYQHQSMTSPVMKANNILKAAQHVGVLSTIWFLLCAGLVFTRSELVFVFFSFLASFGTASILSFIVKQPPNHLFIRNSIGLLTGALSSIVIIKSLYEEKKLGFQAVSVATTAESVKPECLAVHNYELHSNGLSVASIENQPEFRALALITGYLVFDLWYTHIHCKPILLPSWFNIWENALTLSLFLTILAKVRPIVLLVKYRSPALVWIAYKIVRLALEMKSFAVKNGNLATAKGSVRPLSDQIMHQVSSTSPLHPTENRWIIYGVSFDLTEFVHRHPGGVEAIELARGRDCTALFESYHPFTDRHWQILEKYRSVNVNVEKMRKSSTDPFYEVLKQRVSDALIRNGIDPVAQRSATFGRAVYYLVVFVCMMISAFYHVKGYILGSFAFAVFGWLLGALGHDAGHYAASRKAWINDVCVWGISLLCNPVMWQHQHTYAHHSHTNDFDKDPDLHHFQRLLRVHRRFKYESIYAYQRNPLYVVLSYTLVVFGTCLWIPFQFLKEGSMYGIVDFTNRNRTHLAVASVLHLVLYVAIIVVGPFFFVHPLKAASCVIVHVSATGLFFAFFSQINHLNELSLDKGPQTVRSTSVSSKDVLLLQNSWAAKQIQTSNNFATTSLFWHFLSNGLNMQIEHHLFPGLNHCHLHLVQQAVQDACVEYGLEYKNYESWSDIVNAMLEWLDMLSIQS